MLVLPRHLPYILLACASVFTLYITLQSWRSQSPTPAFLRPHEGDVASHADAVPKCSIWPDWRQTIPTGSSNANASAIPPLYVGSPEIMSDGGCVPFSQRMAMFGHPRGKSKVPPRTWKNLRWGQLQSDCAASHFSTDKSDMPLDLIAPTRKLPHWSSELDTQLRSTTLDDQVTGRTAIVLRPWRGYAFGESEKAWIRTIATETALDTGGRFQVFLLVDIHDPRADLSNPKVYERFMNSSVPVEFRDMAVLWNRRLAQSWYPRVGEYSAQHQMYQPLQIFSFAHPEYDHFWQLEMDVKFTGNVGDMLTRASDWAQQQPRKNLWERNARYFVPGLWRRGYAGFAASVDKEFRHDTRTTWGPAANKGYVDIIPQGPKPPPRSEIYWGVGEDADLITLSPMIDPVGTGWIFTKHMGHFSLKQRLPRRMAAISVTRTSRRLLRLISVQQRDTGSWVVSEATPETWSFLHGLKAVYVPHLVTLHFDPDEAMTPKKLDRMLHRGPRHSLSGGPRSSLLASTDGINDLRWHHASYFYMEGDAFRLWHAYLGGACMPPMILHAVKTD